MRIGSECGRLIKDGLPHCRPHGFTHLVVSQLEILAYLRVLDSLQTCGPETSVGEESREFHQGETICREYIQGISQKLVGPRTEMVEVPALPQDLGKLCD